MTRTRGSPWVFFVLAVLMLMMAVPKVWARTAESQAGIAVAKSQVPQITVPSIAREDSMAVLVGGSDAGSTMARAATPVTLTNDLAIATARTMATATSRGLRTGSLAVTMARTPTLRWAWHGQLTGARSSGKDLNVTNLDANTTTRPVLLL